MSMNSTLNRVFNFSAGPAVLPQSVLEQVRDELLALPGVGSSILEISHRGQKFIEILETTSQDLRTLMGISDDYEVLYLQGGSRLQFSMIPMNLMREDKSAGYLVTGSWGDKACKEASIHGDTKSLWSGKADNFNNVPAASDLSDVDFDKLSYVHYTSNETIQGVQFPTEPDVGSSVLVSDASSDFLSCPVDVSKYGLIYACAQKNAGPAGLTVVIVRKDLMPEKVEGPTYLSYKNHADADSCYNTPPTFAIYVLGLVCKWLQNEVGGLEKMKIQNEAKSKLLYDVIDQSGGFYSGHAVKGCRSKMNVTFNLPSEDLLKEFLSCGHDQSLTALAGHRSVGGIRASIYNAMPVAGVKALASFMTDFASKKSS